MVLVLALALDGVEDAVEGGLHADHLALHDLEQGREGWRGQRRGGGGGLRIWTHQVLALEARKAPVGGWGRRWMAHDEHSRDMAGGRGIN